MNEYSSSVHEWISIARRRLTPMHTRVIAVMETVLMPGSPLAGEESDQPEVASLPPG